MFPLNGSKNHVLQLLNIFRSESFWKLPRSPHKLWDERASLQQWAHARTAVQETTWELRGTNCMFQGLVPTRFTVYVSWIDFVMCEQKIIILMSWLLYIYIMYNYKIRHFPCSDGNEILLYMFLYIFEVIRGVIVMGDLRILNWLGWWLVNIIHWHNSLRFKSKLSNGLKVSS